MRVIRPLVVTVLSRALLFGLLVIGISSPAIPQTPQSPLKGAVSQSDTTLKGGVSTDVSGGDAPCWMDAAWCYGLFLHDTRDSDLDDAHIGVSINACRAAPVWRGTDPSACWPPLLRARQIITDIKAAQAARLQHPARSIEELNQQRKEDAQRSEALGRAQQEAEKCFAPIETRVVSMGGSTHDRAWVENQCAGGPPSSSSSLPARQNARRSCVVTPAHDEWGKWTQRVADAVAQHYQSPFRQKRTIYFEFTVDQQGRTSGLTVGNLSPDEQRRAGDAFQAALSAVNPSLLVPPHSPRPAIASVEVVQNIDGCLGPGGYKQFPALTASTGATHVYPPLQQASEFSNHMRAAAEQMLQAAGRIAKASTDANDVTKHNNVGIGVAFSSAFGAVVQQLRVVVDQYRSLAALGHAAGDENAVVQMADAAVSESQTMAAQASNTVSQFKATGAAFSTATYGAVAGASGYLEDAVILDKAIGQGDLPTCTIMSCYHLATLLEKNTSLFTVLSKIQPQIKLVFSSWVAKGGEVIKQIGVTGGKLELTSRVAQQGEVIKEVGVTGGLNIEQVASALKSLGIPAQTGSGLTNMMNEVNAGRPVIAFVKTLTSPPTTTITTVGKVPVSVPMPLHSIVVEGLETRDGVQGLRIYDPMGWIYWQPLKTFSKYFADGFAKAL